MKEELKEIKPTEGLGQLRFGMTRDEVRELLGEPNEIDTYSFSGKDDEDLSESWHYDDLDLSMSFDQDDDWRLITLAVSSSYYQIKGRALVNLMRDDLVDALHELGIDNLETDDEEVLEMPNHQLMASENLFMNFWLEDNRLKEIQWSPVFSDDDHIEWPQG